jgi:hypothetical protein
VPTPVSILTSIKKVLLIDVSDTSFDQDVMMHTNSALSTLTQLGIGPPSGILIEDATTTWDDFVSDNRLNMLKSYVYLRVRLLFDPPSNPKVFSAMQAEIAEYSWRLNVVREGDSWVDPTPPPPPPPTFWPWA